MLHLLNGIAGGLAKSQDNNLKVGGVIASVALAITAAGIISWKQSAINLKSGFLTNNVIKNILKTSFRSQNAASLDSKSGEILSHSSNGVLAEKNGHRIPGKNGFSELSVKDFKKDSVKEVVCEKKPVSQLFTVNEKDNKRLVDGNDAASYVAFNFSDHVFVYPGTGGKKYFGESVNSWVENRDDGRIQEEKIVKVLDTRIGAGEVILGASLTDSLVSALLPSESLSYMLPSIQRIVGYKKPVVFHINSRAITANHSVQSDYSSVYTAGTTGISVLGSTKAQEIHDFAVIAHLAALRSGTPFLHFFDGANVAHKTSKIRLLSSTHQSLIRKQELHKLNSVTSGLFGIVDSVMNDLAPILGKRYHPVEYVGHPAAEHVIVSFGGSAAVIEEFVRSTNEHIGVVIIHLIRPWSADYFWSKVPATAKVLAVLDQDKNALPGWGPLYREILASVSNRPLVKVIGGSVQNNPDYNSIRSIYDNLSKNPVHGFSISRDDNTSNSKSFPLKVRQISFWDNDDSVVSPVPAIAKAISSQYDYVDYANYYDTYCVKGVSNTILRFGDENLSSNGKHHAVVCLNEKFITEYDMLNSLEDGGVFILNMKEQPNFPAAIKRDIVRRKIQFFGIDTNGIAAQFSDQVNDLHAISIAIQAVVISRCADLNLENLIAKEWSPYQSLVAAAIKSIKVIEPSNDWLDSQDDVEQPLPTSVSGSILPQSAFYEQKKAKKNYLTSISNAAAFLTFQNIYHTKSDLRSVGASHGAVYRTKLTKWLRLTPLDYDRNIFHLEIDIRGTGLKYDMGEALAVYGLNPTQQVANFLDFYNLNSNDIICIGQTHSGEYSIRTIFQLFQQYLDIFGRPSKKFYQALAGFAKNPQEKEKLEFIISDKGQEEFKDRVKETITYEDLLREFPSAKPTVEELIELIPPVKPRHYSIASSMKMHPDSVHLLVVVDDWKTPSGKYKVGQCSGYLAGLTNPETEDIYLTVSVAPSLMKLPPKNSQPVVMAGLGTGMAPFRAFIQERQYLQSQGEKVGPMALYFGSRFRAQEYLYGEELEAYHASGLLTYLRLAFSRDQKDKVYIQHKLGSDKSEICNLLLENKGHFYLCGPTWPAGDVYDAIVANFMNGGMTKEEAQQTVYKMKEDGRYVLEVY